MKTIKPLYIWWITNLLVLSGTFWAWYAGIISKYGTMMSL